MNSLFRNIFLAVFVSVYSVTVSANVFNPANNIDFNLSGDTRFDYETFTLGDGLTLNYFAPENSLIEIYSEGDINIAGDIHVPAKGSTLSFLSNHGSIYISGRLDVAGQADLDNGIGDAGKIILTASHSASNQISVAPPFDLWFATLLDRSDITVSNSRLIGNLGIGSSITLTTDVTVQTIPLPAAFWLFMFALGLLPALRKPLLSV